MLRLENISKYYYSKNNIVCALNHINISFETNEFVAVTGESGSGKSTLLNVLSGLDTFEDGRLYIQDEEMTHFTIEQLEGYRNKYIGFVFQDYNIMESYTVFENVITALLLKSMTKESRIERAKELITLVGLEKQMHQKASTLSGGEKQRTVIARALAKDAPIIVCDEPTGNLDEASAIGILELLHTVAKDKCVIVVTHNFDQVKPYATRKIRLYDGDIIEDQMLSTEHSEREITVPDNNSVSMMNILKIAWFNLKNIPKKTFFMMIIVAFIIVAFMSAFAVMLDSRNTVYQDSTDYFDHVMKHRLIVTKDDKESFTEEELNAISDVDLVLDIVEQDHIFDLTMSSAYFDEEYEATEFDHYNVYPSVVLDDNDLIEGRLPLNNNEIVIGYTDLYQINDYIAFSPRHMIKEVEGVVTDIFVKKIVGFIQTPNSLDGVNNMYFSHEGLEDLEAVSNYKQSRVYLDIDGVRQYVLTSDIRFDDTLEDGVLQTYDMLFFDICRDFGYKEDVPDDFDAGLCPVYEYFIPYHIFSLSVVTRFENTPARSEIEIVSVPMEPTLFGQGLYVSTNTFNEVFHDDAFQITAVVYDMYEAMQVKSNLEEMGYNVFYPAGILSEEDALDVLSERIQLTIAFVMTVVIVYFVGYFVLRTVTYSKQKDYIILRSIGATRKNIMWIMFFEISIITFISMIVVLSVLLIYGTNEPVIADYLRYFSVSNMLFMILSILLLMSLMMRKINHHMFKQSVIASLRIG